MTDRDQEKAASTRQDMLETPKPRATSAANGATTTPATRTSRTQEDPTSLVTMEPKFARAAEDRDGN